MLKLIESGALIKKTRTQVTGISYLSIHLLALIFPGWLITRALNLGVRNAIFIPATAFMYFAAIAVIVKWQGYSLSTFYWIYIGLLIPVSLLVISNRSNYSATPIDKKWLIGLGVVVAAYCAYRYLFGPYTELPADLYRHLEYARVQLDAISKDQLGPQRDLFALLNQKGLIWHSFFALTTAISGLEFSQTLPYATFANTLVFLISVYSFAWYIFDRPSLSPNARLIGALLATFFVASQLGLNVFSYIRYYSLAPTMLNMVVYFAAIIVLIELLKWQGKQLRYGLFIISSLLITAFVHTQEALFILVYAGMLIAWFALSKPSVRDDAQNRYFVIRPRVYYIVLLVLFVAGFIALEAWTYTHHLRPTQFFNKVLQLSEQGPILNRILFLNPSYQAFEVVTVWGLFVYALFIFYWRKFVGSPYLFAGMFIPLATVFNPVFVDWFLRMDGVHTLWRMLYIIPTHFVAALLVVYLFCSAKFEQNIFKKIVQYSGIAMLFLLLLPIPNFNSNSRLTLAQTDSDESYRYWQDLIDYLNQDSIKTNIILTDPVTGYMLNGLSKHRSYQYKFLKLGTKQINFEHYDNAPLQKYKNWLLIINDREGGFSETGERSKHWGANILQTSDFYTQPLRAHIKNNPDNRFKLEWEKNGVRVYKIQGIK